MTAYTLNQLAAVNNQALEKDKVHSDMTAIGASDKACFALLCSDSRRDKNVVRFFHDYGHVYAEDLYRYIDHFLEETGLDDDPGPRYTLGQLSWIAMVGMFPSDMIKDLAEIGESEVIAASFERSAKESSGNVVKFWELEQQILDAEVHKYFDAALTSYPENWPHSNAPTSSTPGLRP